MAFDTAARSPENGIDLQDMEDVVKRGFLHWQSAKQARGTYDKNWDRWYRRYAGQHYDHPRPQWKSSPVVNLIFSTIETVNPIMTDQRPQITVVANSPQHMETGELLSNIVRRIWVDNDMDLRLPECNKNALKYGTGFMKVFWDPRRAKGKGDVAISVVDPRHIFPSPGAKDFDDAEYVIFAANVPRSQVLKRFPDAKGKEIPPGVWDEDVTITKDVVESDAGGSVGLLGPIQTTDGTKSFWPLESGLKQTVSRDDVVTLVEYWFRDGQDVKVCFMANGVKLKGPLKPYNHNKFPFVKFIDYVIPGTFWGMGEIQQLEPVQLSINARRGQIMDILKMAGNPAIIADIDSGINPKALRSKPGLIVFKNRGTDVHWMQAPNIPAGLFELQQLDKFDFDTISGVYDVTQGRKPVGIEAASAIVELQEAAQTRIRLKTRNMEASLRKVGQLAVDLVQEFYTEERAFRIVGGNSSSPDFVRVNIPEGPNRINDVTVGEFDVEIGVGSTMPVNKTRNLATLIQLFQLGIVDEQAVLEATPLSPEQTNQILARIRQRQALMAQAGAAGAPQEGGPSAEDEANRLSEQTANLQLQGTEERNA